ncbi:hypothetical protein B0H10DRAFT_2113166 [Mycena sp. CBHHK59/15]|nr:hypothetical protein B0H10DRAFT_2113166 [Mycena sp. CBHHK59/15]
MELKSIAETIPLQNRVEQSPIGSRKHSSSATAASGHCDETRLISDNRLTSPINFRPLARSLRYDSSGRRLAPSNFEWAAPTCRTSSMTTHSGGNGYPTCRTRRYVSATRCGGCMRSAGRNGRERMAAGGGSSGRHERGLRSH